MKLARMILFLFWHWDQNESHWTAGGNHVKSHAVQNSQVTLGRSQRLGKEVKQGWDPSVSIAPNSSLLTSIFQIFHMNASLCKDSPSRSPRMHLSWVISQSIRYPNKILTPHQHISRPSQSATQKPIASLTIFQRPLSWHTDCLFKLS